MRPEHHAKSSQHGFRQVRRGPARDHGEAAVAASLGLCLLLVDVVEQVAAELSRRDVRKRGRERGCRGSGDGAARGLRDLLGPFGRRFRSNTYLGGKGDANTDICRADRNP